MIPVAGPDRFPTMSVSPFPPAGGSMRIARSLVVLSVVGALSISARPATAQVLSADTLDVIQLDPVQVNVTRTPFALTTAPFAVAVNDEESMQRARPGIGTKEAFV